MVLRIGTDCSGIESPIEALKQLEIPYEHIFSCEIDKYCKKSLEYNCSPKIFFNDITKRDISEIPNIDLYVAGFPCQPFSNAGKRKGFQDERGNIFWNCLRVIKYKKPKYFILENVKGLTWHDKGKTWKIIKEELENLQDYNFYYKVLNTRHYGIPQNRERLYMIGIRKELNIKFDWPKEIRLENDIKSYIDEDANHKDEIREDVLKSGMLERIPKDAVFIDFSFKKHSYPNSNKYCPTIAADSRLWCIPKNRYATVKERLALQGFELFKINENVSEKQLFKQIGNAMSVNVLKELFKIIFRTISFRN